MKKIIFAVTNDLNYDQRMHRICHSLHALGYQVMLVGRERRYSLPLTFRPYRQHRLKCFFNTGKLFYAEFTLRLWCYLRTRTYDVYCAVDLDTALPLYFRARATAGLFGYDAHEYFPEVPEVTDRPGVKRVWEAIERYIVPRTDFAYTVTASLAWIFEKKYNRPFEVIRNLSYYQFFDMPVKKEKIILYQGALNIGRGLEPLLEAMQHVEAKLMICGEGDLYYSLQQLSKELRLSHKVCFTGFLLPEQLLAITRQAYIGIMLLENNGLSYYHSLANKFFDYIQAGIPQVAVDFPEYRTINGQYHVAILVTPDPDSISQALNRLLHDQSFYKKMAINCEKARQELNWQREELKLIALYEQLWQTDLPPRANT